MVSSSSTSGSHTSSSMAPPTFPFSLSLIPLTLKLDELYLLAFSSSYYDSCIPFLVQISTIKLTIQLNFLLQFELQILNFVSSFVMTNFS
ncbi:LOW QUALITY PROTEIN: hypothetical protein PanWU01x14_332560 [Parasponia andersonii]|uniref:Uncharacterized protein n=1 Tax=Parasponia andersonii TaxID=3476 RepID=A0A2P5AHB9_PARAD|nr:LOW QUALITY PROTEIN: hypothetical protein PanWU01x14_332560 [Parasponia andersonii]